MKKTIYIVDDNDTNLTAVKEAIKTQYRVITLSSAAKMFSLIEKVMPDLILLDIKMPEMDGFEALSRLKANPAQADIPVIFLTSATDAALEARGFQMGAIDFITKPFSEPVLLNRIKTHLNIDELIRERTAQLLRLQNGIVFVLADMVENRDKGTGGHVERTAAYLKILVSSMIGHGAFTREIPKTDIEVLVSSARLHDIGKITISDTILNKPGKLTDEEFEIMKTHAAEGVRIINQIVSRTDDVDFLRNAILFAGYHHERWDGAGYPYGLSGATIPLQGRVMAIVDVYDALVSERPYKKPFPHSEAASIIRESSGKQFDPRIVELFKDVEGQFAQVSRTGAIGQGAGRADVLVGRTGEQVGRTGEETQAIRVVAADYGAGGAGAQA